MTGESISLGGNDPRGRRDLQDEKHVAFPLIKRAGRIAIQLNPRSAVYTDPALGIGVRVAEGSSIGIASASPFALVWKHGEEFEERNGRARMRLGTSVQIINRRIEARPTASEVSETTDGDTQSAINRLGAAIASIESDIGVISPAGYSLISLVTAADMLLFLGGVGEIEMIALTTRVSTLENETHIEARTDDPVTPVDGRMWLRTDL